MNNLDKNIDEINKEEENIEVVTSDEEYADENNHNEENLVENGELELELKDKTEFEEISEEEIQENIEESIEDNNEDLTSGNTEIAVDSNESEEIEEKPIELSKEEIEKQTKEYHKNLIEAALYAAGKPLNVEILSTKLEITKREVDELLNELAYDYLERSTALIINQVGDSYQMAIKSEYVEKISKFASGGAIAEKYLRTLTIIALKQPLLKSTVIKLRGTGAYEHVKYLLDMGLIDGIKKGRSQELTTTDKYAEMFGLPKDKEMMKQMMVAQLGLGDQDETPEYEPEDEDQNETPEYESENEDQNEN